MPAAAAPPAILSRALISHPAQLLTTRSTSKRPRTTQHDMAGVVVAGEERGLFTSKMKFGPHLLAPTGSDLAKYDEVDTIFAGWHTDLCAALPI